MWARTQDQVNSDIKQAYATEIKARWGKIEEDLTAADAKYHAMKESEIMSMAEQSLEKFANNYFTTRRQAMIDSVDLTIRREKENLMHQRRVELLPLSTSLSLSDAHQALNEGLAESAAALPSNPQLPPPTSTSQALPGASQLDSVIASLSDMILAKINDLAVSSNAKMDSLADELEYRLTRRECDDKGRDAWAARGGGFTTARKVAFIHECATDNMTGHQLTPNTSNPKPTQGWGGPAAASQTDQPDPLLVDVMQTQDDFNPAPDTTPALPRAHPPANAPKSSYAAKAGPQNTWHTVQARKGKNKQANQPTNQPQPTTNKPPKAQKPKPTQRPETLRMEITVQRPPGSVVTTLTDASLICRRVVAALRVAKSDLPLLSGRWATHTHNYVYTFAGNILFTKITQVAHILLQPFPHGVLAPCAGWA
jgi:hypothetical protein